MVCLFYLPAASAVDVWAFFSLVIWRACFSLRFSCVNVACVVALYTNDDVGMVCYILSSRLPWNHIVAVELPTEFMLLVSVTLAESTPYEVD